MLLIGLLYQSSPTIHRDDLLPEIIVAIRGTTYLSRFFSGFVPLINNMMIEQETVIIMNNLCIYIGEDKMRKNTMLTLEESVTETAKTVGINLSQVAEKAIKERMQEILRPRGQGSVQVPQTEKVVLKNVGPFQGERGFEFSSGVNIIVGPNASGKTTIIDSLRAAYGDENPPTKNDQVRQEEESWIRVVPVNGAIERGIGNEDEISFPQGETFERFDLDRFEGLTEDVKEGLESSEDERALSEGDRVLKEIVLQSMATRPNECYLRDGPLAILDMEMKNMILDYLHEQEFQVILTYPDVGKKESVISSEDHNLIELEEKRS